MAHTLNELSALIARLEQEVLRLQLRDERREHEVSEIKIWLLIAVTGVAVTAAAFSPFAVRH
ncbi:hypothetical protein ACIQF6_14695 [Kitasatospora sp. NPDC092948]|uniref:hypothetical protein n=1 Tax=Kitasatospora sp. NPDC092948 TaxID=3364088 RepID=UPI003801A516